MRLAQVLRNNKYRHSKAPQVLFSPTMTAGWATFGAPLAPGDLPSGRSLNVSGLDTQTDVKTTWPDGSAKFAIVTCKPTGTATMGVSIGDGATGSFTPTIPTASVVFTVYDRYTLLGDFSITSGTLKVKLRNAGASGSKFVADAILIEVLDGSGNPTGVKYIVDNADGSPAYTESGTWTDGGSGVLSGANCGVNLSVRISTDDSATATWQKTGLASGTYRVSASWVSVPNSQNFGYANTQKAGYETFDNNTSRGELFFAQVWDSGEVGGTTLGDFSITSGTCNVRLGDDTASSGVFTMGERVALYLNGSLVAVKGYNDSGVTLVGSAAAASGYAAVGDAGSSSITYYMAASPGGTDYVQWQFTSLASGTYRIVVWQIWGEGDGTVATGINGVALATDSPWTVLDNNTSRGTVTVNQKVWSGRQNTIVYTATLSGSVGSDVWLSGSLCKEWRRYQSPVSGSSVTHPALLVTWDVRCFKDGSSRVQVGVENTYTKARVKEVFYDVSIVINSSTVYTNTKLEHYPACRWTQFFTVSGLTESSVTPDFSRANSSAARLIPKYQNTIGDFTSSSLGDPDGGDPRWQILRMGGISQPNMYTGDVNYVGPYPVWVSAFIVHNTDFARRYMLATARNSIAAYPVHFRDPSDNTVYNPETHPNFWPDPRSSEAYINVDYGAVVNHNWRHFLAGDLSHHPQAALIPYLLTGERYLADELAFWITFEISGAINRLGAQMILESVEARAIGWSLRTVAENTAFLPDAHEAKAWGATCVTNTIQWHDDYAAGNVNWLVENEALPSSPIAYVPITAGIGDDVTSGAYPRISANWQNVYIVYGITLARDLGLVSSSIAANAISRLTGFSLGAFGNQQDSGFPSDPSLSAWPRDCNPLLLINAGFDGICTDDSNYAKDWNVQVGTAGTHVVIGSRSESIGTGGLTGGVLKLVSDGSTLAAICQQFNTANSLLANAGGTVDVLANSTNYYVVCWMKISATDTVGTIIFELTDGSNVVHNSQSYTVNANTLTTSYVRKVFTITTTTLPGAYRLRIRFGSSPTSGRTVYIGPIEMYQVPKTGTRVQSTGFYGMVGFAQSGTNTYAVSWDELFACHLSGGRNSGAPFPNENNFSENALCLNIAERLFLDGASTAYVNCINHPNFSCRDNFNFVRGMYV